MAVEYPDIMNDLTDARRRFESGAVQFLAEFSSPAAPAGSMVQLPLTLQSVMNVPVQVAIRIDLPQVKGKLKRLPQPLFHIFQPEISLTLEAAEVVQLTIPLYVQAHVPANEYKFMVGVRSAPTGQGVRIRSQQGANRFEGVQIHLPQGLGITQIVPWGFEVKEAQRQVVSLTVTEPVGDSPGVPVRSELEPQLNSVWVAQDWDIIPPARRELNERRIHLMPLLTPATLFVPLMKQSQQAFAMCGVQFHVAEAIFIAKVLTYTVTHLASNADWLDGLLVPIYAFAQVNQQPTDDVVWLLSELGYIQVLELAIALSFSLIEDALKRQVWSPAEQRAVRDFIVSCLDSGGDLPDEFVYLPLLLGGLIVAPDVVLEGEDVQQSVRMLAQVKAGKAELFADPDLSELNVAFDHILARRIRQ